MNLISQSLRIYFIFTIILGVLYPFSITGIAQFLMPHQANGSLIIKNNEVIGSSRIGQQFTEANYFQSRPSAVNYDAAGSGASNVGPTSKVLMKTVAGRIGLIRQENVISGGIPADMVLASASGLDPHISVQNALLQVPRIAKKRKISETVLGRLVRNNTDKDFIGLWGQSAVNVLQLNISLDKIKS